MKSFGFLFITVFFLLLTAFSCGTVKESGQGKIKQEQAWEYNRIPVLDKNCEINDFPAAGYNPAPDRSLRSMFTGKVVNDSFRESELNIFEGRLIIQIEMNYVLYNENQQAAYHVMVFGFKKNVSDGMTVAPGDVLGHVDKDRAGVMVFSKTLDPYLVVNSDRPPVFYAGYFWFYPSFLATGGTGWMSFIPVDSVESEVLEIKNHMTGGMPGIAVYDKKIRFKTQLSQYPQEIPEKETEAISAYENILYGRNGIVSHFNEINADGYSYILCWQKGFNEYLRREYALDNDIWLYGVIVSYDVWAKKAYVFLRDFTPVSVEEMYEGRIKELRG